MSIEITAVLPVSELDRTDRSKYALALEEGFRNLDELTQRQQIRGQILLNEFYDTLAIRLRNTEGITEVNLGESIEIEAVNENCVIKKREKRRVTYSVEDSVSQRRAEDIIRLTKREYNRRNEEHEEVLITSGRLQEDYMNEMLALTKVISLGPDNVHTGNVYVAVASTKGVYDVSFNQKQSADSQGLASLLVHQPFFKPELFEDEEWCEQVRRELLGKQTHVYLMSNPVKILSAESIFRRGIYTVYTAYQQRKSSVEKLNELGEGSPSRFVDTILDKIGLARIT